MKCNHVHPNLWYMSKKSSIEKKRNWRNCPPPKARCILSRPRILFYKRVSGFESSIECCSHLADVFHLFFVLCVLHVLCVLSVLHFSPAFPTNSMSSHPGWQHGRTCRSPSEWIVGSKSVYIEFPDCRFISLAGKERVSKPFWPSPCECCWCNSFWVFTCVRVCYDSRKYFKS